jgi:hypothetical protein
MLGPYLHIKLMDDSMIMTMRLIRAMIASLDHEVLEKVKILSDASVFNVSMTMMSLIGLEDVIRSQISYHSRLC